jgi:monomeric sarcosine oxidase
MKTVDVADVDVTETVDFDVDVDVAVVGAGLMGTACAWSAARRGLTVLILEQFPLGHSHGSSHGSARIVRRAYADPLYTELTGPAFELWQQLEDESGASLLRMLGGIDHGSWHDIRDVAHSLEGAGVEHELLSPADAERRWPGMRFAGSVLYHAQGGTVDAAAAVQTLVAEAVRLGATLRESTAVTTLRPDAERVLLTLAGGSTLRARSAVIAAGGWTTAVLRGLVMLPSLTVTEQHVFHFPRRDPTQPPWPSVIHRDESDVYHLAGGRDGGPDDARKIGEHGHRIATTAGTSARAVDPVSRERLIQYVERWLPGLEPDPIDETTCLYTATPSEDFIVDRVGPLVVCSPCSGHGAKFAPLIGDLVCGLLTGDGPAVPERFRLSAHALATVGARRTRISL